MHVDGRRFMCRLALILSADLDSGYAPEVIARIFPRPVNQQILFFVNQVLPVKLSHLKVRRQLDGVCRAGFLAIPAKDTAREVDAEEIGISSAVFVLGRLQRDTVDRTGDSTEIACHTALASIWIAGQNDPAAIARRQIRFLLGILNRDPLLESVEEYVPDRSKDAQHALTP